MLGKDDDISRSSSNHICQPCQTTWLTDQSNYRLSWRTLRFSSSKTLDRFSRIARTLSRIACTADSNLECLSSSCLLVADRSRGAMLQILSNIPYTSSFASDLLLLCPPYHKQPQTRVNGRPNSQVLPTSFRSCPCVGVLLNVLLLFQFPCLKVFTTLRHRLYIHF